jgi:hypothetical protein
MTALRPMLNSRISLRSLALARFPAGRDLESVYHLGHVVCCRRQLGYQAASDRTELFRQASPPRSRQGVEVCSCPVERAEVSIERKEGWRALNLGQHPRRANFPPFRHAQPSSLWPARRRLSCARPGAAEQEFAFACVARERCGALELHLCLGEAAELEKKVAADAG